MLTISRFALAALILAHAILGVARAQPSPALSPPDDPARTAARLLGLDPTALTDATLASRRYSGFGVTVTLAKAIDRATGTVHFGAFDPTGRRVDLEAVQAVDAAIVAADASLKLTPALRERLGAAAPGETIEAGIWLHLDRGVLARFAAERMRGRDLARTTSEELREIEAEVTLHAQARVAEVVSPFVQSLAGTGLAVRYASRAAPAVIVRGTAERLAALAARVEIDTIFDQETRFHDLNQNANDTHRTSSVQARGVSGNGIRVAMLEDNRIDPTNPFLDLTATFNASVAFDDHVHGTAGCIQSSQVGQIGSAPDVDLLSAGAVSYADADVIAAGDWIATQDVDITNMSWGACTNTPGLVDAYFDFQSRVHFDSYVAAAGNASACTGAAFVGTPGMAYNVIACGNFADAENSDWTDDVMNAGSCFVDPTNGLQKPNVAANGTNVTTLDNNGPAFTQTSSGTSFSAPHTSGNLACAMQVNTVPKAYPQAAMALMMATAWHNIEGATRLSDVDGAGGIDGYAAYKCALDGRVRGGSFVPADFDANDQHVENIWLESDQRARVCLAWSSETVSIPFPGQLPLYLSFLGLDLDLAILQGSNQTAGPILASSSSSTNNYEIVEFTPPVTGFYSVRIDHNGTLAPGVPEPWGLAWSQESDQAPITMFDRVVSVGVLDVGKLHPGHRLVWDVSAPGFPNRPFVVIPSGTSGATLVPGGKLPIQFDPFTFTWLALLTNPGSPWQGTVGVLDGEGRALAPTSFAVPPLPSLIGQDLHHVPVVLDIDESGAVTIEAIGSIVSEGITAKPVTHVLAAGQSLPVSLPFLFPFMEQSFNACFVNSNGTITFGAPNADPSPSVGELVSGPPRIAALWDFFAGATQVSQSALVTNESFKNVVFTFYRAPAPGGVYGDVARVTLRENGEIALEYGPCETFDGLVGVASGLPLSMPLGIDFSRSGGLAGVTHDTVFEEWANVVAPFDLGATIEKDAQGIAVAHWNTVLFRPTATGFRVEIEFPDRE